MTRTQGKIALEEHFTIPGLEECITPVGWAGPAWQKIVDANLDVKDQRLEQMDQCGIQMAVLSLGAEGIQGFDHPDTAISAARAANDGLAEIVASRPDRFAGFAALPLQDPAAAAAELERAVTELGLVGAMANGFSNGGDDGRGLYYDAEQYLPFWETVAELDVPFYLHPRNPAPHQQGIYAGRPELLGPTWAFAVETGTHALRLISSGLFDRFPSLNVILGHLGENLPFSIARMEQRLSHIDSVSLQRPPTEVFGESFYITTSGNYSTPTLIGAMLQIGADHIMFAADYPFEQMADGADWFDTLPISDSDRRKIGSENARALLGLHAT